MRSALLLPVLLVAACSSGPARLTFTTLDAAAVTPLDVRDATAHVLLFIMTDCPIANAYAPEIRSIIEDFSSEPVRFFLVHVDSDLDRAAATAHATDYSLPGPIVLDPRHELVRATGATITPEAVVVGPKMQILYRGRIDNWFADLGKKRPRPTRRDLRDALRAALDGQPIEPMATKAIGCFIPELPTAPARSAR